tara:strand:+ start:34558 stop:36114 length:1557 start_codon:yes stop_codon:yes gene_type:complete
VNVLIINLTRFGDLIQTQPVISGYRQRGAKVALACLQNFASASSLLNGVDHVFSFPGADLLSRLDTDWRLAVKRVDEYKAAVFDSFKPDVVINLTPSVSSRLLTRAMTPKASSVAGFSIDDFGFNADTSAWAAYLQLAGGNRAASPFNICDIFRRTAGLNNEGNSLELSHPGPDQLERADVLLSPIKGYDCKGIVALQMGASEDKRRWPVDHFRRVTEMVWQQDGYVPVLLGTKEEQPLGKRFKEGYGFPVVDLMGQTSLQELSAVLLRSKALVTNDTGTMHLAAGLGVPVSAVFLATAQPWDTGPYRPGNICLEPDLPCHPCEFGKQCPTDNACRQSVDPTTVYQTLGAMLNGDSISEHSGARVWLTRLEDDGFMGLESLSGHDQSDRALWIALQRAHYLPFLDGNALEGSTGLAENLTSEKAAELSKTLTSARDMLFLLSRQGMLLLKNPRPQAKAKFLATWQGLQNVLSDTKELNILGSLWMFQTQQCGDDMASLLEMIERYRALVGSLCSEFEQ